MISPHHPRELPKRRHAALTCTGEPGIQVLPLPFPHHLAKPFGQHLGEADLVVGTEDVLAVELLVGTELVGVVQEEPKGLAGREGAAEAAHQPARSGASDGRGVRTPGANARRGAEPARRRR